MSDAVDLTQLLLALADARVSYILVGGLAAVAQGAPVMTFDVDIVHERDAANCSRLVAVLAQLHARYRGRPDRLEPTLDALMSTGHQLLATDLGPLDVLGAVEGGRAFSDLVAHTVTLDVDGRPIRMLRLEKLLELKLQWNDDESRARAALYERALRHT